MRTLLARPAALVVVALVVMTVLRLLHLAELKTNSVLFHQPMVDALEYFNEAWLRASGKFQYRVPSHGPLYPALLGYAFSLCDGDPLWLRFLQSLAGQMTVLLLYFGGRRMIGDWPAVIAAALFAVYRPGLLYECELYAAGLATLLVTAVTVLLVACAAARPGWWRLVGLGLCLGFASITRTNLFLLTPIAAGFLFLSRPGWRRVVVLVLVALLPIGVVTLCNHAVSGEWIPVQARTGHNLYQGNHPGSDGTVDIRPGPEFETFHRRPRVEADAWGPGAESQFYMDLYWEFVTEHPGEFAALLVQKTCNSLSPIETPAALDNESNSELSYVLRVPLPGFAWLLPFVFAGLLLPRRDKGGRRLHMAAVAVLAAVWVSLILGYAAGRYRFQVAGLLCLFAATGLCGLFAGFRERDRRRTIIVVVAIALGLLVNALTPRFEAQRVQWRAEFHQLKARAYLSFPRGTSPRERVRRLGAAEQEAGIAIRLAPEYAWPRFTMGWIAMHGTTRGELHGEGARLDFAIAHYTEAIKRSPDFVKAIQNRAAVHMELGDTKAAIAGLRTVVTLVPYSFQAWGDLGRAYGILGDANQAKACRARALEEKKKWDER